MAGDPLLRAAVNLVKLTDKAAVDFLPEKLVGIVRLHSGIAVGTVMIPVPGADIAAAAANIWTMYARINSDLGLPFGENVIKSVAAGVATNLGSAAAALLVVGSAMKLVPGLGSFGGAALMAATIYGLTTVSGIVYLRALAALAERTNLATATEADLKAATESAMKDKQEMKDLIKKSGKNYKSEA